MEKVKTNQFKSLIKQTCINWLSIGLIFSIVLLAINLVSGDVRADLGPFVLEGVAGGIATIIIGPIVFLTIGLILGLCGFMPFTKSLKHLKKNLMT